MATTPEGKVKAKVKDWLKARGIWYCMPIGTGMGNSGVPDFVCCWAGRFLAIETKAPGKRKNTTALQDRQIAAIQAAMGSAYVIDDVAQLDELFGAQATVWDAAEVEAFIQAKSRHLEPVYANQT